MIPQTTLRRALEDPNLLGNVLAGDSWRAWRILLIAAVGEALDDDERVIFQQLTGRDHEPGALIEEFIGVVGRRGGKSRAISVLATFIAGLCRHPSLVRGERGVLLIVAQDQRQADVCLDYITANFEDSPLLYQLIEARVQRSLRLTNGVTIEVRAADFRSLRGNSFVAVVGDEVGFWMNENSANPDTEILNAIRPGLATTGGPLIMISSPHARRGELWNAYDKHFGAKGDAAILVAQAAARVMNASLPQSVVDRAYEKDPASASAEYGALFRTDVETFVSLDKVRACISVGTYERPREDGHAYLAFVDPSGGQADSMTLCIAHMDYARETVVIDCLREHRAPCSAEVAAADFAQVMKSYGLATCYGDKYGQVWVKEQFARFGICYVNDAEAKSLLYGALLAAINSGRVDLLDSDRLVGQLVGLERSAARGGRDSIDHARGGHDDVANACAGAAAMILARGTYNLRGFITEDEHDPDGARAWRAARLLGHIQNSIFGGRVR